MIRGVWVVILVGACWSPRHAGGRLVTDVDVQRGHLVIDDCSVGTVNATIASSECLKQTTKLPGVLVTMPAPCAAPIARWRAALDRDRDREWTYVPLDCREYTIGGAR